MNVLGSQTSSAPVARVEANGNSPPAMSYRMSANTPNMVTRGSAAIGSKGASLTMPLPANLVPVRHAHSPQAQVAGSSFQKQFSGSSFHQQVSGGYTGGTLRMASSSASLSAYAVGAPRTAAAPKSFTRVPLAPSPATVALTAKLIRSTSRPTLVEDSFPPPREVPLRSPTNLVEPTTCSPDIGSAETALDTGDMDMAALDTDISMTDLPSVMTKFEAYLSNPDPAKKELLPHDVAPVVDKLEEKPNCKAEVLVADDTSTIEVSRERALSMDVQKEDVRLIDQDVLSSRRMSLLTKEASQSAEPKPPGRFFRGLKCFGV